MQSFEWTLGGYIIDSVWGPVKVEGENLVCRLHAWDKAVFPVESIPDLAGGDYVLLAPYSIEFDEVQEEYTGPRIVTTLHVHWAKKLSQAEFEALIPPEGR